MAERIIDGIAEALETSGYIVLPAALPEDILNMLFVRFKSLGGEGFLQAGIGKEEDYQRNPFVRSDTISWLDPREAATAPYFHWSESLRAGLNQRLFLGLFDYECHFAYYPRGAFYKRHLDAFQGNNARRVSSVLYLNPEWLPGDGGELVLYAPDSDQVLEKVTPRFGTLVLFLSEVFPHEVLAARRPRYSLTGWYRINTSLGGAIDPAR